MLNKFICLSFTIVFKLGVFQNNKINNLFAFNLNKYVDDILNTIITIALLCFYFYLFVFVHYYFSILFIYYLFMYTYEGLLSIIIL